MPVITVTAENFQSTVEQEGIVLLDFWAPWCGPCRQFGPVFEKAADTHADIKFGKINTDEQQELSGALQIQSIPTLMVFRDKVMVFSQPGALPPAMLDSLIQQVRGLDMVEIHKRVAESEAHGHDHDHSGCGHDHGDH